MVVRTSRAPSLDRARPSVRPPVEVTSAVYTGSSTVRAYPDAALAIAGAALSPVLLQPADREVDRVALAHECRRGAADGAARRPAGRLECRSERLEVVR